MYTDALFASQSDFFVVHLQGDVTAMLAMGDLYYYGARGLPQDYAQVFCVFAN